MAVKLTKLVGLKKEEFDLLVKQPESPIQVRPARLIPVVKIGRYSFLYLSNSF